MKRLACSYCDLDIADLTEQGARNRMAQHQIAQHNVVSGGSVSVLPDSEDVPIVETSEETSSISLSITVKDLVTVGLVCSQLGNVLQEMAELGLNGTLSHNRWTDGDLLEDPYAPLVDTTHMTRYDTLEKVRSILYNRGLTNDTIGLVVNGIQDTGIIFVERA